MSKVLVILLGTDGYDRAAEGVLGAGRRLADALSGELEAVVLGSAAEGMAEALAGVANRVVVADQEELCEYQPELYLRALAQLAAGDGIQAVLFGNDTYSQEIVPRLARRLGGSCMADVADIKLEGDRLHALRAAYGGKAAVIYELKKNPVVLWMRARALAPEAPSGTVGEVTQTSLDLGDQSALRIIERQEAQQEGVRLEDATVIVSGGRGLGGPEPFEQLQELANVMGAQMGASRAACDAGWVPPTWQVGQTGKKVAPELYLAIAISGASQHLLGMGDSKVIAAVNTDPDAPIFKHCSFGIVEDYKNVVPLLIEKVSARSK